MLFMTVPTAGSRPELLEDLVRDSNLPSERIIVVVTRPGAVVPQGVTTVEDFGPLNIQRWWKSGIEEAIRRGATAVAVLNDDLRIAPGSLQELAEALHASGAAIATPSRPPRADGLHRGRIVPYSPRIWGCLWVLDTGIDLRPDPRYVWWYGDNDLDIRARRDYGGIVSVPVEYEHLHGGEGSGASEEITRQTHLDAVTFQNDYARIITLTSWVNRVRGVFGKDPLPF